MCGPVGQVIGPAGQVTKFAGQVSGPASAVTKFAGRVSGPTGQVCGPGGRVRGPGNQVTGLAGQVTASPGPVSGPAGQVRGPAMPMSGPAGPRTKFAERVCQLAGPITDATKPEPERTRAGRATLRTEDRRSPGRKRRLVSLVQPVVAEGAKAGENLSILGPIGGSLARDDVVGMTDREPFDLYVALPGVREAFNPVGGKDDVEVERTFLELDEVLPPANLVCLVFRQGETKLSQGLLPPRLRFRTPSPGRDRNPVSCRDTPAGSLLISQERDSEPGADRRRSGSLQPERIQTAGP